MTNSTRYHIRLKKPGMVLQCNISIFFYVRIAKVNFVTYLLVRSLEFLVNDVLGEAMASSDKVPTLYRSRLQVAISQRFCFGIS